MIPKMTTTMNNTLIIAGILFVLVDVIIFVLVIKKARQRKVSATGKLRIDAAWKHVLSIEDPVRRVMEADKVLDIALTEAKYTGSLGEKLKVAGPRFSDINAVWRAHKLRNTLAHEAAATVNADEAAAAVRVFERAIRDLM